MWQSHNIVSFNRSTYISMIISTKLLQVANLLSLLFTQEDTEAVKGAAAVGTAGAVAGVIVAGGVVTAAATGAAVGAVSSNTNSFSG